jgi:capsular exopolysaccharide synthesis family protein
LNVKEALRALRIGWWLLALGLLVGGAVALTASLLATPLYSAQTQMFVSTTDSTSTSEVFQGSQFSQQRVGSYARLLGGDELAGRVIDRLDLSLTPAELSGEVAATAVPDTVLLDVTVTDPSARQAQQIAAAIGTEFPKLVADLETPDGGIASPVKVTVTDRPELPVVPSTPRTKRNVALGCLVGLVVGAAAAVARTRLDRTVREPKEAAMLAGAPVIGTVIRDEALGNRHVVDRKVHTRAAEDYRQLRTNLQFLNVDEPPKVIMVSSAMPAEGKTTATINLALALAEAGRQVTILDADLRRPRVTSYLGMVSGVGLTNILAGTADLADVLQTYGDTGVSVIGAGPTPPNPSELLASKHMFALIDELRGKSEYVLIDAPPLLPVADSTGLAVMVDGALLSVRYGKSRKDQLQQAAATLERVGARTLGLILNIVPPKAGITAAYGYGYTYAEDGNSKGR